MECLWNLSSQCQLLCRGQLIYSSFHSDLLECSSLFRVNLNVIRCIQIQEVFRNSHKPLSKTKQLCRRIRNNSFVASLSCFSSRSLTCTTLSVQMQTTPRPQITARCTLKYLNWFNLNTFAPRTRSNNSCRVLPIMYHDEHIGKYQSTL